MPDPVAYPAADAEYEEWSGRIYSSLTPDCEQTMKLADAMRAALKAEVVKWVDRDYEDCQKKEQAYEALYCEHEAREQAEAEVERLRERLEPALARIYKLGTREAVVVGRLCDDELDRSGAMLGRVRDLAAREGEE